MELFETVKTVFLQVIDVFANINLFPDIIDILLVALLAYALITQLRKSQSIQVIKGIIVVAIVYGLVNLFNMTTSKFIFTKLFSDKFLLTDPIIRLVLQIMSKGRHFPQIKQNIYAAPRL